MIGFLHINVLIPAYNPTDELVSYVRSLLQYFPIVIVVDDGSKAKCQPTIAQLKKLENVFVLSHVVNQGKGAALKTGMNFIVDKFADCRGVVTADADGQHLLKDVIKVAEILTQKPDSLVIGGRCFEGKVPLRSRIGNTLTRMAFRVMAGIKLHDTQSGLRGIPFNLSKRLLRLRSNGYEFESDMLLIAHRWKIPIVETTIATVYVDNNQSSNFNPIFDSLKIYFVLFRFIIIAIFSALIDYAVFIGMYFLILPKVSVCLIVGRVVSMFFNYFNVRRFAFHSEKQYIKTFPQYFLLALFSFGLAYVLIKGLMNGFGIHVIFAKIISELILFVINFLVQRYFIFRRDGS